MKLVVDANILFAALIKDSTARWLLFHLDAELIAPEFILEEIKKYQEEILRKSKLTESEFISLLDKIKKRLIFLPEEITLERLEEAQEIMKDIDEKDSVFLAAALIGNAQIWSDDPHLHKQHKVKAYTTKELVHYL